MALAHRSSPRLGGAHRRITVPNWLTLARIGAAPLIFIAALFAPSRLATGVYLIAIFTDAIDGRIARRYDCTTPFGRAFDSTADKLAVLAALGGLSAGGAIGASLLWVFATREFLVFGLRSIRTPTGVTIAEINDTLGRVRFLIIHIGVVGMLGFGGFMFKISEVTVWVGVVVGILASCYYIVRDRELIVGMMRRPNTEG